ncbi:hypothetical protein TOPH_09195 [Tolypocladium ophioglossoides CBS 100239]|uniref:Uncharacterized protein n=1 Tax=Tolypocladium ophioglossoides (strain CBS 100239) TaxID=1163406 RepID=A0A0L0MXI0_TOLOC|nr:hypothetical protein TOPH_09195 [Tolypocladium ophioglossoides CBS 100239]
MSDYLHEILQLRQELEAERREKEEAKAREQAERREKEAERREKEEASTTRDLGTTIHRKQAGNENAVDHFEKLAVEDPVWEILHTVWDEEELREEYRCMGLRFSNNIRDFTQPSDDDVVREEDPSDGRQERRRRTGPNKRVFDYMVRYEVAYGYIAAGESLLFLHINRADPQTLYCHPCVPDEDVGEASNGDWADKATYTAVAQLASFCLLSLRSEALKGASLDVASRKAEATLKKWREPYDDAARLLGAEDTDSPPASSSPATDGSEFMSNAVPVGREVSLRSRSSCRATAALRRDEEDEEDDGPDGELSRSWARTDL